ncbi:hypothetical protein HanIR_Chr16g0793021 [Helianthus annuus]|nr:hypothetical protein HanIR_Chr16g0793021 [Helianthus annuus]
MGRLVEEEDSSHLFIRCLVAKSVWGLVLNRVGIDLGGCNTIQQILSLIIYTTIWRLWINRNSWRFSSNRSSVDNLLDENSTHSFNWVKGMVSIEGFSNLGKMGPFFAVFKYNHVLVVHLWRLVCFRFSPGL